MYVELMVVGFMSTEISVGEVISGECIQQELFEDEADGERGAGTN